ncbi:serine hydroxymethyltransferase family protein [Mycobacterium xenopi 4042]|uniref:Serine hydroxymethyltransferase family protein n=1 Tax=Mycobacterium xenopi 4042 TaxID=1299334 RepID=X8ANU9_MYCXE|nr:serine hydroxymethyltransferase family protein [Mycobacterium xenopi 4042]
MPVRADPRQAGVRQSDQLRGISRPAGRPLLQAVAAKAVTFKIASTPEFAERQRRTLSGARIIAERLLAGDVATAGVSVVSGGTDVHLVLVDLRDSPLDGKMAEDLLHDVGITVNRNAVPTTPAPDGDLRAAGGTSALATRGFGDAEFTEVADIIATALAAGASADVAALRQRVTRLAREFPLYEGLEDWKLVDSSDSTHPIS